MIHHGDCVEVMAGMEPESVDAIVTDPPYDLTSTDARKGSPRNPGTGPYSRGFMGKAWDGTGIAFRAETWEAALRVAKPSAYLLAFGGTRTVHRMATAIEDAGWIIRDMLVWAYASGFPKSKASLKPAWEPIVMARKPGPLRMLAIDECRIPLAGPDDVAFMESRMPAWNRKPEWDGPAAINPGHRSEKAPDGRWPANVILTDPIFDGGVEGVVGGGYQESTAAVGGWAPRGAFPIDNPTPTVYGDSGTYSRFFLIPRRYNEPCPDCGRVRSAERPSSPPNEPGVSAPSPAPTEASSDVTIGTDSPTTSGTETPFWPDAAGTTPSTPRSRLHETSPGSEPASSPAKSPDAASPETGTTTTTPDPSTCATCADPTTSRTTSGFNARLRPRVPADDPDHTRFLLIPKADRSDREPVLGGLPEGPAGALRTDSHSIRNGMNTRPRANVHPTVKPTELMRHLVRLVTPTGGTVLDPFLGSGTTAIAAELEGFDWIGIEKEAEYVAIAEARLNGTQRGLGLSA